MAILTHIISTNKTESPPICNTQRNLGVGKFHEVPHPFVPWWLLSNVLRPRSAQWPALARSLRQAVSFSLSRSKTTLGPATVHREVPWSLGEKAMGKTWWRTWWQHGRKMSNTENLRLTQEDHMIYDVRGADWCWPRWFASKWRIGRMYGGYIYHILSLDGVTNQVRSGGNHLEDVGTNDCATKAP